MKLLKMVIIMGILCSILASLITPLGQTHLNITLQKDAPHTLNSPRISAGECYDAINDMFDDKYSEFTSQGYFSQNYESSLQATYYALYILDVLGKLDTIDLLATTNYIMSWYDEVSGRFIDSYAQRYLQTNFSNTNFLGYYQFPSLLEVNCFAILSLEILGELDEIDNQQAIDFIWSCLNQPTERGFIGQPYFSQLTSYFKISTADDTYFAILALDALGDSPGLHIQQWLNIEQFIKDLQNTDAMSYFYGAFYNDEFDDSNTLDVLDFTLLTSYYCLRSLEKINALVQYGAFHQFLEKHYDDQGAFFKMRIAMFPLNESNVIGTALGLHLSDLSGYLAINRNAVLNFILNNRNSRGLWNSSSAFYYHELIDAFQVIRALEEMGELDYLSSNEKDQIATSIQFCFGQHDNGFSLLSKDYSSLRLMHTIVKSALGIYREYQYDASFKQKIYNLIWSDYENLYGDHLFAGATHMFQHSVYNNEISKNFRSEPIEFYNAFYDDFYNNIGLRYSHETTYYALEVLYYIGMLGTFGSQIDLNNLVTNIIGTQFLAPSYENYGGFIANPVLCENINNEQKNNHVFLEYTYYAFRSLEILAEQLGISMSDTGYNEDALVNFVDNTAGDSAIHYDAWYSHEVSTLLRNTYYMVYILNATAPERLDVPKIRNYVVQNLNYSDIKNIYYSYKISELLDLTIAFDTQLTNQLARDIYDSQLHSYYLTSNRESLSDEVFLWICDMARHDPINITAIYPQSVELGNTFNISVSLNNIMLDYFGPDVSVKLDATFDHITLSREPDMSYKGEAFISNIAENFPAVTGEIEVSGGPMQGMLILPINIQTTSSKYGIIEDFEKPSDSPVKSDEAQLIEPSVHTALPLMITLIALPSFFIAVSTKSRISTKSRRKSDKNPFN